MDTDPPRRVVDTNPISVDLTFSEEDTHTPVMPVKPPALRKPDCKRTDPASSGSVPPPSKRRRTGDHTWEEDTSPDCAWDDGCPSPAHVSDRAPDAILQTTSDEDFEQQLAEINNSHRRVRQGNRRHDARKLAAKKCPQVTFRETFSDAINCGDSTSGDSRSRRKRSTPVKAKAKSPKEETPPRVVEDSNVYQLLPKPSDVKSLRGGPARQLSNSVPLVPSGPAPSSPSRSRQIKSRSSARNTATPATNKYVVTPARELATIYNRRLANNPIWREALRLGDLVRFKHTAKDLQRYTDEGVANNVGWIRCLLVVAPYLRHPAEPTPAGVAPWPTKRPGPTETLKEKRRKADAVEVTQLRISAENDLLRKYSRNQACLILLLRNEGNLDHLSLLKRGTHLTTAEYAMLKQIGRDIDPNANESTSTPQPLEGAHIPPLLRVPKAARTTAVKRTAPVAVTVPVTAELKSILKPAPQAVNTSEASSTLSGKPMICFGPTHCDLPFFRFSAQRLIP